MDVYERLQRDDLMQGSVVMAWFVYNAAMRDRCCRANQCPSPSRQKQKTRKLSSRTRLALVRLPANKILRQPEGFPKMTLGHVHVFVDPAQRTGEDPVPTLISAYLRRGMLRLYVRVLRLSLCRERTGRGYNRHRLWDWLLERSSGLTRSNHCLGRVAWARFTALKTRAFSAR